MTTVLLLKLCIRMNDSCKSRWELSVEDLELQLLNEEILRTDKKPSKQRTCKEFGIGCRIIIIINYLPTSLPELFKTYAKSLRNTYEKVRF